MTSKMEKNILDVLDYLMKPPYATKIMCFSIMITVFILACYMICRRRDNKGNVKDDEQMRKSLVKKITLFIWRCCGRHKKHLFGPINTEYPGFAPKTIIAESEPV